MYVQASQFRVSHCNAQLAAALQKTAGKNNLLLYRTKKQLGKLGTSERPSWLISFFLSLHISSFFLHV